jgi:6-phosphofructokinase 1
VDKVCDYVKSRFETGTAPIIVIAEGAIPQDGDMITKDQPLDAFGHVQLSGIGDWLAAEIETKTGYQTRCTVLGHIQRGGTPSAFDRVLSSRFGLEAITAVHEGDFGKMMALHGTKIARVPLASATDVLKTVPIERYEEITSFFG